MDQGFGIDIDKVLDDFEKNEDNSNIFNKESNHSMSYWISKSQTEEIPAVKNRNAPFYAPTHTRSEYVSLLNESAEKICLADADFSASSTSLKSSVLVPVIVSSDKPAYDNSLCYSNRFAPPQKDKWFIEGVSTVGVNDSVISNGFEHEEEEEVLAVQVMTSLDQPTNFEIKLLPGDQASSDIFNKGHDLSECDQNVELNGESRLCAWEKHEDVVHDTRQVELPTVAPPVDSVLVEKVDISNCVSVEEDAGNILNLVSSAIESEENVVSVLNVSSVDTNEHDQVLSVPEDDKSVLEVEPVVVGFDDDTSDINCDDIDSYLSNVKISEVLEPSSDENSHSYSTQASFVNEYSNTDTRGSTNEFVPEAKKDVPASDVVVENSNRATTPVPNLNAYLVNTGARPKVRDSSFSSDVSKSKDQLVKDVQIDNCLLEEKPQPTTSNLNLINENFSSVNIKTVDNVQEQDTGLNLDSTDPQVAGNTTDLQSDSEALQAGALETEQGALSAFGKKQRPTSLNLSGCLSSGSSGAGSTASTSQSLGNGLNVTQSQAPAESSEKLVDLDSSDPDTSLLQNHGLASFGNEDLPDYPDLSEEEQMLGKVRPFWIPDVDAPTCMHCDLRFTVLKRRHHCRACGKVLCSQCCSSKTKLPYLEYKEVRVCRPCLTVLMKVTAIEHLYNPQGPHTSTAPQADAADQDESPGQGGLSHAANTPSPGGNSISPSPVHHLLGQGTPELLGGPSWSPNPNNPPEYCSKVPPLQQALSERPPPTVLVPVGVLKRGDRSAGGRREPKQVMFSDGIRPGGDLTDLDVAPEPRLPYRRSTRTQRRVDKGSPVAQSSSQQNAPSSPPAGSKRPSKLASARGRMLLHDEAGPLPPLLSTLDFMPEDNLDSAKLLQKMQDETCSPAVFALTKNFTISVKIIKLDCCMGHEVWCFSTSGMASVGQDEVLFLLQRLPDENTIPRDALSLLTAIYDNATKGTCFNDLGHLLFPEGLLGAREHAGVLFVRPSHQCQSKLPLPQPPYLVALLIQKWEVPWAKVFPLRLLLRIGAEFRYYPCPLVSVRFRNPVYGEIGHTIMDVLADFRNYQYTLPVVPGVTVCMEDKKTTVSFPRNRYDPIMKLLNSSNDNVLGLGASFCTQADSHLVCMQNEDGSYQTQAINIQNTPHKVTGASFIVFSGALKSSSGMSGKSSIVEDGLLVQITQDSMGALKAAIRDMKDYLVTCGQVDTPSTQEQVLLKWTADDKAFNFGVKSPIDGRSLEGVESVRIQTGTDYATDKLLVRWTEVFFLVSEPASGGRRLDSGDFPCKLLEAVSQACCLALTPCLSSLMTSSLTRIGLRVTMDTENVGYEIGSCGKPLEGSHMVDLDSALIPLIMGGGSLESPLVVELIFHVLHK